MHKAAPLVPPVMRRLDKAARWWRDADHNRLMRRGVIGKPSSWILALAMVLRNRNEYKGYNKSRVSTQV